MENCVIIVIYVTEIKVITYIIQWAYILEPEQ